MTEIDRPEESLLLTSIGVGLCSLLLLIAADEGGTLALVSTAAALMLGLYGLSLAVRSSVLAESLKQLSMLVPAIALGVWGMRQGLGRREGLLLFLVVMLLALLVYKVEGIIASARGRRAGELMRPDDCSCGDAGAGHEP